MGQLPLKLELDAMALFETFVPDSNRLVLSHVEALAAGEAEILWLAGPAGSGKSHLLQAACRAASAAGRRAMYLPLSAGERIAADMLQGLETLDLLALDDCDRAAGDAGWETALFTLLNGIRANGRGLIMAARSAPAETAFRLPDLASRAGGAVLYRMKPVSEPGQLEALLRHARHRGLGLDPATARYLLSRVPRDIGSVCGWLARLDRESLREQRKLTIPFIHQALARHEAAS